jgi:hypothetical protein
MDMALFEFLGTRFGWSSVIGIVPAAGDAIDAAIALLLVRGCMKVKGGLPMGILIQMLINVAIDFLIGLIPFLGDIADAYFKANTKNCRLLEEHLDSLYKPDHLKAVKDRSGRRNPPAMFVNPHQQQTLEQRSQVAGSALVVAATTTEGSKTWRVVPTPAVQLASITRWRLAPCATTEDEIEAMKLYGERRAEFQDIPERLCCSAGIVFLFPFDCQRFRFPLLPNSVLRYHRIVNYCPLPNLPPPFLHDVLGS